MDVWCFLNNRSSCRTSEFKMFADPRKERENERKREEEKRETERCALHYPRYFRARANFTHTQISTDLSFFYSPVSRLYSSISPKRRIFIQKLFFGDKIVVMIDDWPTRVLTRLTGRCTFQQVQFDQFFKFIPVREQTLKKENARHQTADRLS